jgi:4a-hydroxytetrahydrobiopterin dehydratase
MSDLASRSCVPCRGGVPPLPPDEIEPLQGQLNSEWEVVNHHHLSRTYRFKNFKEALEFTNRVGEMAEKQGHHPDLTLAWGRVGVEVWTHKIDGLTESDFVFAAKCDALYPKG